ncbi:hypothetical protein PPK13_gp21 [Bacillus phage Ray17]|uniref:IDEAL domain-containing protein n=1 Tax=Bacillus phage Ray17 TaxID=2315627 RepID=A0A386K735_9CAUD|nr:hypothetical protein PPK13_gp21 [Bacillus phage Ray17]AYD80923.1 hypothetical protein Ray17_22 [Bacillus phage Ray17]
MELAVCKMCLGTGIVTGTTNYCEWCADGRLRKRQHKANIQAQKKREEEAAAKEKNEQLALPVEPEKEKFEMGDWVRWDSVSEPDSNDFFFGYIVSLGKRVYKVKCVGGFCYGVFKYDKYPNDLSISIDRLEHWNLDPAINMTAVDLALKTNDREWFNQLTKGAENNEKRIDY